MRGDVVILCSDGLYRALGPEEIARLITPPAEAQQTAEVLLAAALARALPNQDNVTILCVKVTDPGYHPQ
jgi:serine/threonine protein phosphatase PrpC